MMSRELFLLTKSMTGHEKRYFKLFSSLYKRDKHYLTLFEAIDRQKEKYNEAQLLDDLKGEKWISHLPTVKNQLYNNILRSLEIYSMDSSVRSQLNKAVTLYNKGLYSQTKKIVTKLKPILQQEDDQILLLEALHLEQNISRRRYFQSMKEGDILGAYQQKNEILKIIENENAHQVIADCLMLLVNKNHFARTTAQLNEAKKIFSSPLLQNKNKALSNKALMNFYFSHVFYYSYISDFKKSCKYTQKQLELIKQQDPELKRNYATYFNLLTNFLQIAIECKKIDNEFNQYLIEFESFYLNSLVKTSNDHLKAKIFTSYYLVKFLLYNEIGEPNKFKELLPAFYKEFEFYTPLLSKIECLYFDYYIAIYHILTQKYSPAYNSLEQVITSKYINDDLLAACKLFQLFITSEMDSEELLEANARSTYRYLQKRKTFFEFERTLIRFIKKVIKYHQDKEKMNVLFIQLRDELEKLKSDSFEKRAFEYFDIISWLDSKIENRPLAEIVREKANKSML